MRWLVQWKGFTAFLAGCAVALSLARHDYGAGCRVAGAEPPFPYPAPVTNPSAFGGEQIDLTAFVRVPLADGWYTEASYAQPIYLDLNGPQSSEKYHFSIEIGTSF